MRGEPRRRRKYDDEDEYDHDDDFDRPRLRRRRTSSDGGLAHALPYVMWGTLAAGVLLLGLAFVIPAIAMIVSVLAIFLGLTCAAVGSVWLLIVVASDDIGKLLLCLFIPFYSLFYILSNFEETKRPFILYLLGILLIVGSVVVSSAGLEADRRAREREVAERNAEQKPVPPKVDPPKPAPPKVETPVEKPPIVEPPIMEPMDTDPLKPPPIKPEPIKPDPATAAQPFAVDPVAKAAGKTVYLSVLTPFAYKAGPWKLGIGVKGEDGKTPITFNKKDYKYALSMHPPRKESSCLVSFVPGGEFTKFRGWAGIADGGSPFGPTVFAVYGDGVKLWESKPIDKVAFEGFDVNVKGVKVLTLETRVTGFSNHGCHAVWFDPWFER